MAQFIHEIWIDSDGLESLIIAGEIGREAREDLGSDAKLVHTFLTKSHFEAMTIYNAYLKREEYQTDHESDHEEYTYE